MKRLVMLLMLAGSSVMAQTPASVPTTPPSAGVGLPASGLNLSSLSGFLREDFAYDNHGVKWFGLHVPVIDYHDIAGDELFNLNGGLMWAGAAPSTSNLSAGSPSGFNTSLTFRMDYFLKKINGTHLTTPLIPKIEFGPMAAYLTAQKEWVYGLQISTTFGQ